MFERIHEVVIEAGRNLVDKMNSNFKVETKASDIDLVTEMDKKTEKYITEEIKKFSRAYCFWRRNGRRYRA